MALQNYSTCDAGNQFATVLMWAKKRVSGPFELLRFFAGLSLTLGPFVYMRHFSGFAFDKRFTFFFVLTVVMSFFGGSDITRIFYSGYPLYVGMLVQSIQRYGRLELVILGFAGLIANRFLNAIPDPQNYWPNHDTEGWFTWTPDHADVQFSVAIILYWVLVYAGLIILRKRTENSDKKF